MEKTHVKQIIEDGIMKKELSSKQDKFCIELLKHFNASKAAIDAGYSRKTARQSGYQLLTNIYIQKRLAELTAKQAEKAEITIEWIITELKQMYERCQSSLNSPGAIAGATKQLELLGKYLGMWIDKTEHSGDIKINVIRFGDIKKAE